MPSVTTSPGGGQLAGLAAVEARGYCIDQWRTWCQGECFTYAVALIRMRPRLHFGTAGILQGTLETIVEDGWRPEHHFAHDEHWVYDAGGMHPRDGYSGVNGAFDYVEFDGNSEDWDQPDELLIAEAQDHARRNGIFTGRYGPVATVVVNSHRARAKLDRVLGYHHVGFYNADGILSDGNDYHLVPTARMDEVLAIKGIKLRKRPPANLALRWSTDTREGEQR